MFYILTPIFVSIQILSNTIKQGVRTGKCLFTKQSLIVNHQTFPFGQGLMSTLSGPGLSPSQR